MSDSANGAAYLCDLARQVRHSTLELLAAAPETRLQWAPAGTSNHIIWHSGHALWLQDRLCIQPVSGESELPSGWDAMFGMDCDPVRSRTEWPCRRELRELLSRQLTRIYEVLRAAPAETLVIPTSDDGFVRCVAGTIIHGLHDEARHQGEMYLLIKLARKLGP